MKALRHTHRNDHSIRNVAGYKEAYDIICNLSPEGDGGEVTFDYPLPTNPTPIFFIGSISC